MTNEREDTNPAATGSELAAAYRALATCYHASANAARAVADLHDPPEPDRPMSARLAEIGRVVEELEAHGHTVQCVDVPWWDEMPYIGLTEPLYDDQDLAGRTVVWNGVEIGWPVAVSVGEAA